MLWLTKNVNREKGKLQIGPEVSWRIINVTFPWHLVGGIAEEPEDGEEGSWDMSQWGDRETGRTTGQKEHRQQQRLPPWASWQILQLQLILLFCFVQALKHRNNERKRKGGTQTDLLMFSTLSLNDDEIVLLLLGNHLFSAFLCHSPSVYGLLHIQFHLWPRTGEHSWLANMRTLCGQRWTTWQAHSLFQSIKKWLRQYTLLRWMLLVVWSVVSHCPSKLIRSW